MTDGVIAVTDHAVERFRQRVGARRGGLDTRPEIASRVSEAWAAGRVSDEPRVGGLGSGEAARGSVYMGAVKFPCPSDIRGRMKW